MKTHCVRDHEMTDDNVYVDKRGSRHCKTCRRERMAERREGTQVGHANSRKTHCPRDHEYTDENTYRNAEGRRWCRTCMAANSTLQNVKRYGVTPEQVETMSQAQGHACAICREPFGALRNRHIDHDHACCPGGSSCGKCVRALLCASCNHGLGKFLDDPELLRAAALYLERHRGSIET